MLNELLNIIATGLYGVALYSFLKSQNYIASVAEDIEL
jgi:hypothetical protein